MSPTLQPRQDISMAISCTLPTGPDPFKQSRHNFLQLVLLLGDQLLELLGIGFPSTTPLELSLSSVDQLFRGESEIVASKLQFNPIAVYHEQDGITVNPDVNTGVSPLLQTILQQEMCWWTACVEKSLKHQEEVIESTLEAKEHMKSRRQTLTPFFANFP